jgi:serine protease
MATSDPKAPTIKEPPRVAIKLTPQAQLEQRKDAGFILKVADQALEGTSQGARVLPLFHTRTPKEIDTVVQRAQKADPKYKFADLNCWFQVFLRTKNVELPNNPPNFKEPSAVDRLVNNLKKREEIEEVSAMRAGIPPAISFDGANRYLQPAYQEDSPFRGLDIEYAWKFGDTENQPQGINHGEGIKLIDIEAGWETSHEDWPANIPHIRGLIDDHSTFRWHGTNVLGTIFMQPNDKGGIGIAYGGQGYTMGRAWQYDEDTDGTCTAASILESIFNLEFGDVVLLEDQTDANLPIENAPGVFDIIRIATAIGIIVIEAAGNAPLGGSAADISGMPDSGAIIVGASNSTTMAPKDFSNYGDRVDVFAWGQDVWTTGSSKETPSYYTDYRPSGSIGAFDGTSAASAIIAGAVMVIQGIAQKMNPSSGGSKFRFSPSQMRQLIKIGGTPSDTTDTRTGSRKVGVMPNLRKILESQEVVGPVVPDIYIRRTIEDNGDSNVALTIDSLSLSPDVFVQPVQVQPGEAGASSEGDQTVIRRRDNYIYIRLQNRGARAANSATVAVYWSKLSSCQSPSTWKDNLIDTATFPSDIDPNHANSTLSQPITWNPDLDLTEQLCFIAIASCPGDQGPSVDEIEESLARAWTQAGETHGPSDPAVLLKLYVALLQNNNNVAQRNFGLANPPNT